jgi:hypothetical protein
MRTRILNVLHTTTTLGLVAVTFTGAFLTTKGAYGIISRRIEYGKMVEAEMKEAEMQIAEMKEAEMKKAEKK